MKVRATEPISGPKIVPAPPTMVTNSISTDLSMPKAITGST